VFVWVQDACSPALPLPDEIRAKLKSDNTLLVLNKVDLLPRTTVPPPDGGWPTLATSAKDGTGILELSRALSVVADRLRPTTEAEVIAINARHADALARAEQALGLSVRQLEEQEPVELLASNLRDALSAIGEIGGRVDHEEVLDRLFATFCIGK
jgi:tRNA modification GTPase